MENTAQRVCEDSEGTWAESTTCDIAQCRLGCCVLADQGAFVTLTRCKQLSGFYGITTDFRKAITDELTCIATASLADKGACVYEDPETASKTCIFTTREKCRESEVVVENESMLSALFDKKTNKSIAGPGFYKDILCTAEELGTDCAPTTKTTLVDGKDEVYYIDTCGNLANIYDANRQNDDTYWKKVFRKEESCGAGSSNAGSASCGNCDYYLGSIGKEATRTTGFATYGDYICIDLSCKKQGKKHGESWCVTDEPTGNGEDRVGSRYYKEICLFDEIITEPCADFRGEVCIQGQFGSFTEAACRANRWQDCLGQVEKQDCENDDIRDCFWKEEGFYLSNISGQIEPVTNDSNGDGNSNDPSPEGMCLPKYPSGSVFWSASQGTGASTPSFNATTPGFGTGYVTPSSASGSSSSSLCSAGNVKANFIWVKTEHPLMLGFLKKPLGAEDTAWTCNNSACTRYIPNAEDQARGNITSPEAKEWAVDMNEICYRIGDCGGYYNWLGVYTDDGYAAYLDNKRVAGSGGAKTLEASKAAGNTTSSGGGGLFGLAIQDLIKSMGENS